MTYIACCDLTATYVLCKRCVTGGYDGKITVQSTSDRRDVSEAESVEMLLIAFRVRPEATARHTMQHACVTQARQ